MKEIILKTIDFDNSPPNYIPSNELIKALEIAYTLKRPLLLSGEPGTGKTDFAKWVAYSLADRGFLIEPLKYPTKSSSISQDLFYFYDAVSHFRENQPHFQQNISIEKKAGVELSEGHSNPVINIEDFIELKALGLAYARAIGSKYAGKFQDLFRKSGVPEEPSSTVVLIDEIDKASRDFPNDLLNELEDYEFEVKELNSKIQLKDAKQRERIIIILTSNLEKSLPEAFLRRCIYFNIDFPKPEALADIIKSRLTVNAIDHPLIKQKVEEFFKVRNYALQKKPSTSECIDWIRAIIDAGLLKESLFKQGKSLNESPLKDYFSILVKKADDLQLVLGKTS